MGKIFHPGSASGFNDPISWTDKYFEPKNYGYGVGRYILYIIVQYSVIGN